MFYVSRCWNFGYIKIVVYFCVNIWIHTVIAKIKDIELADAQRLQLEEDFRKGKSHIIPYALSSDLLEIIRFDIENSWRTARIDRYVSQFVGEAFRSGRHQGIRNPSRSWVQAYNGLLGRGSSMGCHREQQTGREESQFGSRHLAKKPPRVPLELFYASAWDIDA